MIILSLVFAFVFLFFTRGVLITVFRRAMIFIYLVTLSGSKFILSYGFLLDKLSILLVALLLWLLPLIFFIRAKYGGVQGQQRYINWLTLLNLFLFLSFSLSDLIGFYIFFELSLIPLIAIVVGWGYQVERIQAAFYLFLYTIFGSLPLLAVIIFINFHLTGLMWVSNMFGAWGSV